MARSSRRPLPLDQVQIIADMIAAPIATKSPDIARTTLTEESLAALKRLLRYQAPQERFPFIRRAAVLVALFPARSGHLNVLLSTRAATMRSYAGDVALPGGKMDPEDDSLEYTARREAFEEVGLPLDVHAVQYLTSLPPFLSKGSNLIVTPIVVYIREPSLQPILNPAEVDSIFSHPLEGFLMDLPREPVSRSLEEAVALGRKPYHLQYDLNPHTAWTYRMHSFECKKTTPIRGFSADVLIYVAKIAYGRDPEFVRKAPGQRKRRDYIMHSVETISDFREAARARAANQRMPNSDRRKGKL